MTFVERLRALSWFLIAAAWFLFSDLVAQRAAAGFTLGDWQEPLYRLSLLFLLIVGYWLMSRIGQRKLDPAHSIALPARPGGRAEFALGAALGWSGVVACVLPTALIGGLVFTAFTSAHQFWLLIPNLIALAAGSLAIEVAFRGYPFLRLTEAMGPTLGAFFMAVVYAIWRTHAGAATTASVLVSFFLGLVLALAVLRTRALWVGWGFHFAWVAAMTILFGLPVSGSLDYSPILVANNPGPPWITGDGQGPEASLFGVLVSFILIFVVIRVTGDLHYRYGLPPIVAKGIPVDLQAAALRQHEAAMPPQPPSLVQILPAQPVEAPVPHPVLIPAPPPQPSDPAATPSSYESAAPSEQPGEVGPPADRLFTESDTESPR